MNLEQLRTAEQRANSAWHKADQKLKEVIREEEMAARERIREAHAGEEKEVTRLATIKWETRRARELGEVEEAKTTGFAMDDGAELHAGDIVRRYGKRGYYGPKHEMRGLVEIATPTTVWPENVLHGRPRAGRLFVRLYKKDGTLGLPFEDLLSGADWKVIGHQN